MHNKATIKHDMEPVSGQQAPEEASAPGQLAETSVSGQLVKPVEHYIEQARRENTRTAYKQGLAVFIADGFSVPAAPEDVCRFLAQNVFKEDGTPYAINTLRLRLDAVSFAHRRAGHLDPTKHISVVQTLEGIEAEHGRIPRRVRPLMRDDVILLVKHIRERKAKNPPKAARDIALLLTGFSAALRRSELCGLDFGDLEFSPEGVKVTLRQTKTKRKTEGHMVGLPFGQQSGLCPVTVLKEWISTSGTMTGPVFRPITRHGDISPARLTPRGLAGVLKSRCKDAGMESADISGHSLRAGFVTSALKEGQNAQLVQAQGGWASPAMLSTYFRNASLFDLNMW
ncbi:MAG: tyrosine-type recombinase/integrase [Gammaproteobacteria bacterium]|nr:tyrosine-type recombinase/integrase [Gammaproteobacteria bacterium]